MNSPTSSSQFNIFQLLALMTIVALLLSMALHFDWFYIPELILDFYKQGTIQRKIVIIVIASLIPTFVIGVAGWAVFRVPYLITSYRAIAKKRQQRLEELRQDLVDRQ